MKLIPWRQKRQQEESEVAAGPLGRLRREMDALFERFFTGPPELESWGALLGGRWAFPQTDLAESENQVTVTMELPGVDPKDVELSISGSVLTVRGEKKRRNEEQRQNVHYVEREYGAFQRSVRLPNYVDTAKVDATFKDGVLTIAIAKVASAQPKRIPLKAK